MELARLVSGPAQTLQVRARAAFPKTRHVKVRATTSSTTVRTATCAGPNRDMCYVRRGAVAGEAFTGNTPWQTRAAFPGVAGLFGYAGTAKVALVQTNRVMDSAREDGLLVDAMEGYTVVKYR